jgi:hypothetical protein
LAPFFSIHPQVDWANGLEGVTSMDVKVCGMIGFASGSFLIEVHSISMRGNGVCRIIFEVHQVAHDLKGDVRSSRPSDLGGLIRRIDIE